MLLIDGLVDEANLRLSRWRERGAGMTLRRAFLVGHIRISHLRYETSLHWLIAVTIGTTPFSANTFPDHPAALK